MKRISGRYRVALGAKALLLLAFAGGFGFMAFTAWTKWYWTLLPRLSGAVLLGVAAVALAGAAMRGVADAIVGDAVETRGAKPLKSRRSGYSLRLPDGKFVEYVLYNPWPALEGEKTYTVVYGKFSRVLVERPTPE